MRVFKILTASAAFLALLAMLPTGAFAWIDPYGAPDTFKVESVSGTPGQEVAVRFMVTNDEELGSMSFPIRYDTSVLTLTNVSFTGGRVDYLAMKLLNPDKAANTNGHFLVGALVMLESPIPVGSGTVFTATFTISPNAVPGAKTFIDTLFYPPGGELIFAEITTSGAIIPVFQQGSVTVTSAVITNGAPTIAPIAAQYVFEGDELSFAVNASDPDGNPIALACPTKPTGAAFTSSGSTGQFSWTPGFTGSFSSDGSPFTVIVSANDGHVSTQRQVQINVLNKNRRPTVSSQPTVEITAGQLIQLPVGVVEPDFETVTWKIEGAPNGSQFDLAAKGGLYWQTTYGDTGIANVLFIATDPHGASDTSMTTISVHPAQLYALTIDTVEGNPGDVVNLAVSLANLEPIAGFNLLIHIDPSSLTLSGPVQKGTRTTNWELITYTNNAGGIMGNIRIVGGADQPGGNVISPLDSGSGSILIIPVKIAANVGLGGFSVPVRFAFEDAPAYNDNTLISDAGTKVAQGNIDYFDGELYIKSMGTVLIGDINLNGIAAEVSDIIYFSNWIVNPIKYPFNALQYANSDVNSDGISGTIADLVSLIQWVVTGDPPAKIAPLSDGISTRISIQSANSQTALVYSSDVSIGGMLVTLSTESLISTDMLTIPDNMSSAIFQDGNTARILIYSMRGRSMPSGSETALVISGAADIDVQAVEAASSIGQTVGVSLERSASMPSRFALEQNYPNPFNPTTQISFSLVSPHKVRLSVYNVLGESIATLADGDYSAGEFTVTWDGHSHNGNQVASGVYFYRLEAGGQSLTRKMMLVK